MRVAPYDPEHVVSGGDQVASRGSRSTSSMCPVTVRRIAFYADGHPFSGDLLQAGSVGRVDLAGGDSDTFSPRCARCSIASRATRWCTRAWSCETLDRELQANSSSAIFGPRATDGGVVPGTGGGTTSSRPTRTGGDCSPNAGDASRLRLAADPDARLRRHRPLRPHVGRRVRRHAQGDVQIRRSRRPVSDPSSKGTAPIARAYVEHGLHHRPQPVKAHTVAPMYRYGRPGAALLRAL